MTSSVYLEHSWQGPKPATSSSPVVMRPFLKRSTHDPRRTSDAVVTVFSMVVSLCQSTGHVLKTYGHVRDRTEIKLKQVKQNPIWTPHAKQSNCQFFNDEEYDNTDMCCWADLVGQKESDAGQQKYLLGGDGKVKIVIIYALGYFWLV